MNIIEVREENLFARFTICNEMAMEKVAISSNDRTVRSYHHGDGPLRGGGMSKMYGATPKMGNFKRKLDNRLGYCIFACLITIATVLVIYGLFHQFVHDELLKYITTTKEIIAEALPVSEDSFDSGLNDSNSIITQFPKGELESQTCLGSFNVDTHKCLTEEELNDDRDIMLKFYITLWNLVTLNMILAMLLITFTCIYDNELVKGRNFKLLFRASLITCLFYLLIQLYFLINPILKTSFYYPGTVDKLLVDKLPRDNKAISEVESAFACQFDYIDKLVELKLQEPCLPRIKNCLLPVYAVILLIVIDLIPFGFIVFTYAWDVCIKDSNFVNNARQLIELNNQRRPQSREEILRKTMNEPQFI